MIEEYGETIGHGRGYPTGLGHEEKMDVIACLLDEGERTYVNEEHTAWISSNQCRVGEMVTLAVQSTMEHTIVKKAKERDLAFGYLLGKVQVRSSGHALVTVAVLGDVFRLKLKRPAPADILPNTRIYIDKDGECNPSQGHDLRLLSIVNLTENEDVEYIRVYRQMSEIEMYPESQNCIDLADCSFEQAAINMILNNPKVATYNYTSGDDSGVIILKAQEKFKESAGSFCNLNSMAVNYKSLTTLKSDMFASNRQVEPVEEIMSYYGIDNIDLLGTAVCDGGSEIAEKTYIGMDYQNPGMKLLYSKITGTTVAPLGPNGDVYDFYPLIEFMRKDIRDELPMYTKLFILTSVGVLMNAPNRIIKGKFRA